MFGIWAESVSKGPYVPPPPTDPYYNNVTLLTSVSGGTMIDQSKFSQTLTPAAGASVDSTRAVFAGTSSMKFTNVANSFVSIPYNQSNFDMAVTNKVWTYEAWVYLVGNQSSISANRLDIGGIQGSSSGWEAALYTGGMNFTFPGFGGTSQAVTISSGVWHHLVWMRSNGSYTWGMDGNILNTKTYTGGGATATTSMHIGGTYVNGSQAPGIAYNIQNVRLTNGVLRYSTTPGATYTVPTEQYPTS